MYLSLIKDLTLIEELIELYVEHLDHDRLLDNLHPDELPKLEFGVPLDYFTFLSLELKSHAALFVLFLNVDELFKRNLVLSIQYFLIASIIFFLEHARI